MRLYTPVLFGTLITLFLLAGAPVTAADHIPEEEEPLLKLYLHYQDGTVHVNALREDHGYYNPRLLGSGDYMARIVDTDNTTLYANDFTLDPSRTHGPDLRTFSELLILPRPDNSHQMILYHDHTEMTRMDIPGAPDTDEPDTDDDTDINPLIPAALGSTGLLLIIVGTLLHRRDRQENDEDDDPLSFWG